MSSSSPQSSMHLPVDQITYLSKLKIRIREYIALSKPRIAVMVMVSVGVGFLVGTTGNVNLWLCLHVLGGIGLTALSSSALNQLIEHDTDSLMTRTQFRPLPTGKLTLLEAAIFGLISGVSGVLWLYYWVNPLTALLAALTLISYVGIYTPLKRVTPWCTAIGAIPGAMPPVLGYIGSTGHLDLMAAALFVWLFCWQFPHFLAIAFIYQEQYRAAGLKMLPQNKPGSHTAGKIAVLFAWLMVPASLFLSLTGKTGIETAITGVIMSLVYVAYSVSFHRNPDRVSARKVLIYSVLFLPVILFLMTFSHWRI